ncbi:DUF305 domain-containing protein [Nocardiopsis halotolerans]|uniref:DUF305 domain-containing protein n=1 Tax=Nocardiopsis halotolerans TaxID=124252 RepID=UPI00034B81B2|nr:DUF305 domain-containing protein [Nocardiopsis halotolerans]
MIDTRTRALLLAPASLAAALSLASCGAEDTSADPAPEPSEQAAVEFNDADVTFARTMIPHHEQAVDMARLAESRAGDGVGDLAVEIEAAQGPEIERLRRMLDAWGVEPADDGGHEGMSGMMTEERMTELEQAEGEAFDTLFLEMMIAHHEGAVEMARDQLSKGVNPEAGALAQDVVDAQEAEIDRMNEMLGQEDSDQEGSEEGAE